MSDNCPKCGKQLVDVCSVPGCKEHVEVYSRIVGYMRPISQWNEGKVQEFRDRAEYDIKEKT